MQNDQRVHIVHRIPGRIRMIVEPIRREPARADRVAALARDARWVHGARASAATASLVIEHAPAVPAEDVLATLAAIPELSDCGSLSIAELSRPRRAAAAPGDPDRTAESVLRAAARVSSASTALAAPHLDLKLLIPGALMTYGLVRVLSRSSTSLPQWMILFKYGFDTFAVLNQGVIRGYLKARAAARAGRGASP